MIRPGEYCTNTQGAKPVFLIELRTPDGLRGALTARYGIRWASILAERAKLDQSLISNVVAGREKNRRARRVIARALGVYPDEIWGKVA